jgi:CheY-like chemotaxis protein
VAPIAGVATARPRALVADDSLTMRLLLARLLEKQGFAVETAASAAELTRWLAAGEWSVLFTDLELPDGGGPDWLRRLCRLAASHPRSVHVVGLVRDGGDLDVARAAGVEDTLLKPFVHEALNALLARRGWGRA